MGLTAVFCALAAFLASIVSGIAGFGGSMLLLPVLVAVYGARPAVPMLTVALLCGHGARLWLFRRHLDLKPILYYCAGALPAALAGSFTYVSLPAGIIQRSIGLFLLVSAAWQRFKRPIRFRDARWFLPVGIVSGFLSAVVGSTGPLAAPFFLYYGLVKEMYLGTDAFCAVATHLVKAAAYGQFRVMGLGELGLGLTLGAIMAVGSYLAKRILRHLPAERFLLVVELLLAAAGFWMLIGRA